MDQKRDQKRKRREREEKRESEREKETEEEREREKVERKRESQKALSGFASCKKAILLLARRAMFPTFWDALQRRPPEGKKRGPRPPWLPELPLHFFSGLKRF